MKKKVVSITSLLLVSSILLSGCGNSEISELNNISALNSESKVSGIKLSASDEEAVVYTQVSDRTLLDLTTLESVDSTDEQEVIAYMDSVDAQLCGTLSASDGVIDEYYTNYLLMEFQKTPYYWQRSSMNIRGMDATSRSIVVDVTYKTIDYAKDVKAGSYICLGEPNYEQKLQTRYERWISILSQKYGYSNTSWESDYNQFVSVYGEPSEIIEAQKADSLTTQIYEKGNQTTYSGLVDSEEEDSSASMTVRYILVPQYTLGINQGFNCEHMYVLNYALDNDPTEEKELYNEEGSSRIADSVYELLNSYYQCEDENDFSGLYSLTSNFSELDKYYEDYFETTYRKHDNFTISLFDVSGTEIECGVSVSTKIRAKGSNMTMPIYTQRWYYTIELIDGSLKITNAVLLSTELEGEPTINTEEVETSGFTSKITLDNQDKVNLENLIANFGVLQIKGDRTSDDFSDIVDTSISQSQMTELKTSMDSVSGVTRVTWITSYLQGQSNYASIKCRELFQKDDNSIVEATVTYEFINKGNKWYVYNYTVNSSAKLDTTDLATKNSLCTVDASQVIALNSQVVSTGSDNTQAADTGIIGTITEYDAYTPTTKTAVEETGLNTYTADSITDDLMNSSFDNLITLSENNKYTTEGLMTLYTSAPDELKVIWRELVANYLNYTNNYINQQEYNLNKTNIENEHENACDTLRAQSSDEDSDEYVSSISDVSSAFSTLKSITP